MGKHRGRPKQARPRSKATTRAGRAAPPDFGTEEVRRLRQILNPGKPGLPADPLSALFARGFIDEKSYNSGRYFSALTAIARHGWNLGDASVAYLYRRMVAGILGEEVSAAIPAAEGGHDRGAADHARHRLAGMRAELWRPGEDGAVFHVVMAVCVDGAWRDWLKRILIGTRVRWAGDYTQLGLLREGLHRLAELTTSRRREVSDARMAAE